VAAGLFGRKTGQGWYAYESDARQVPTTPPVPALPAGLEVWVAPEATERDALKALVEAAGARWGERPTPEALLIVQPWGGDATGEAVALGLDAACCVAIDPLPKKDCRYCTI